MHQSKNIKHMKPLFATINVSKFRDGRVHVRNSGVKGLTSYHLLAFFNYLRFIVSKIYQMNVRGCIHVDPNLMSRSGTRRISAHIRFQCLELRVRFRASKTDLRPPVVFFFFY